MKSKRRIPLLKFTHIRLILKPLRKCLSTFLPSCHHPLFPLSFTFESTERTNSVHKWSLRPPGCVVCLCACAHRTGLFAGVGAPFPWGGGGWAGAKEMRWGVPPTITILETSLHFACTYFKSAVALWQAPCPSGWQTSLPCPSSLTPHLHQGRC